MKMGMRLGSWAFAALGLLFVFLASGCGGGGSAGSLGATNFFLSDAPASDYDQVWVRLTKVEAVGEGGAKTVFENPEGQVFDVASLNDGSARYAFLGSGDLPSGTHSLKVTMKSEVSLLASGAQQMEPATFNNALSAGAGLTVVTVPFRPQPGDEDVVIDFDLSQWDVNNGIIDPVVTIGPATDLGSLDRHEETLHLGTVSDLNGTAPNQSFKMTDANGRATVVMANEATVVYDGTGAMATLANGQSVAVDGIYSMQSGGIVAASIGIQGPDHRPHWMAGRAFDPNIESSTFLCEVKRVHGFVPNHRIVTVSTPNSTVFLSPSGEPIGKERFYEAIDDGGKFIIAAGQYDGGTNVFTARMVKLHHRHDHRHPVRVLGPIRELFPDHRAFVMHAREWHGEGEQPDGRIKVVTGNETAFIAPDGSPIRAEVFFERAEPGTVVNVEGLHADNVVRARTVKVVRWDSRVRFIGSVVEWSFEHGVIVCEVPEDNPAGDGRVKVKVHSATQFSLNDQTVEMEVFFAALAPNLRMGVVGWYDGQVVHAGSCSLQLP